MRYPYLKYAVLLVVLLVGTRLAHATHNRAGEIVVDQIGECGSSLTVQATVITFTEQFSQADRDSVEVIWDDGTSTWVQRSREDIIGNGIKRNEYTAEHTYSGYGTYFISMTDRNRVEGIINVNPPSSVTVPFHVYTIFTLANPLIGGCNRSPRLAKWPLDKACTGQPFTHNPGAYDPDGDSLVFEFVVPFEGVRSQVPNYSFPDQISPGPSNRLTIDRFTGQIVWDAPVRQGDYNLAFLIISYRNGVPIDTMVRDMQIEVEDCDNLPPDVDVPIDEICVIAGDTLAFDVVTTAPLSETDQLVRLTASGGPFVLPISPASFLPPNDTYANDPVTKRFVWPTACEHISDQPYFVVFSGEDNGFSATQGLATLRTVSIKVVGPPPQEVRATASREDVLVSWELPYQCEDAQGNFFLGFTVWRRLNSNSFVPDTCAPGLAGQGYELLTPTPIRTVEGARYGFRDLNVERGKTYCYRILGVFGQRTVIGNFIYNEIESLPSAEVCVQLSRDLPLMTAVDVTNTDPATGSISVCWTRPLAGDLDTLLNPGPYRYELLRATGQTTDAADFQPIGVAFTAQQFSDPVDTCYLDTGLNTVDDSYSYRVAFYVANETQPLGAANPASSVYLTVEPTDRANVLNWAEQTSWDNFAYTVYRRLPGATSFDSLTTVTESTYRDAGLTNGQEYCYYILSRGTYGISGLPSPLLNRSQQRCASPVDNVAPCPPSLSVASVCDRGVSCQDEQNLFNLVSWTLPRDTCPLSTDVVAYRLYYTPNLTADYDLLTTIDDDNTLQYEHLPEGSIAGCYYVTAVDTVGNESERSNVVCVDNCPFYELPNAFTPNGDRQNDVFVPYDYCFIASVDFQVFNRWGQLVFETRDPAINWDGTNERGDELAEGTYFYRCQVFEQRVEGVVPAPTLLSGYIELVR